MNPFFNKLASRIDALSLRERAFLFLSLLAVCVALADTLWVSPARAGHQQVKQRFARDNIELQRLREEVKARALEPDVAKSLRDELAQTKAAMVAVNGEIAALSVSAQGNMGLREVLVQFLGRHAGLTLVRTGNLAQDGAVAAAPAGNRPVVPGAPALLRQGLELTVAGPYPELVRYLQTLESAMPAMRWGMMTLAAEQQPPELSLQVFLVRTQP